MTEDEAMSKWCPFMFHEGLKVCIASGCMAWRETSTLHIKNKRTGEILTPNLGDIWHKDQFTEVPEKTGYCGLAGKP